LLLSAGTLASRHLGTRQIARRVRPDLTIRHRHSEGQLK